MAAFCGVLALESFRELNIAASGTADEAELKKWNAAMAKQNPSRAIAIGKAREEVDEGEVVHIYPLDS